MTVRGISLRVAVQVFQGEMAVGEHLVRAYQRMADTGPCVVLQNGVGHSSVPVDVGKFVTVPGIRVGIPGVQPRQGLEINGKEFFLGIVSQPRSQVVTVGFIGGCWDDMLIGNRDRPEIFARNTYVSHRPVADPASKFIGVKIMHVGVRYSFNGKLIPEGGKEEVGMFEQPHAEVHKHLGVLVHNLGGGEGMVDRFVKENGDQEGRINILVAVDDRISERQVQSLYRNNGEHVGCHEFILKGVTVCSVGQQVGERAVNHIRNQPGVEIVKVEPLHRTDVEFDHGERGGAARVDDGTVVVVAPHQVVLYHAHLQEVPRQQDPAPHFAEVGTAFHLHAAFIVAAHVAGEIGRPDKDPADRVITQVGIQGHIFPHRSEGLQSAVSMGIVARRIGEVFQSQHRPQRETEKRVAVEVARVVEGGGGAPAFSEQVEFCFGGQVIGFVPEGIEVEVVFQFLLLAAVELTQAIPGPGEFYEYVGTGIGFDGGIEGDDFLRGEFIEEVVDAVVADMRVSGLGERCGREADEHQQDGYCMCQVA